MSEWQLEFDGPGMIYDLPISGAAATWRGNQVYVGDTASSTVTMVDIADLENPDVGRLVYVDDVRVEGP